MLINNYLISPPLNLSPHQVSVKFTDFVTKCHVLNVEAPLMQSRLLICYATQRVMETCFQLLGIGTLERI